LPIYEYCCEECGEKFEVFVRSATQKTTLTCPSCGSEQVRKAISLFGVVGTGGSSRTSAASCGPGPV